jgi:hypothetical protein
VLQVTADMIVAIPSAPTLGRDQPDRSLSRESDRSVIGALRSPRIVTRLMVPTAIVANVVPEIALTLFVVF